MRAFKEIQHTVSIPDHAPKGSIFCKVVDSRQHVTIISMEIASDFKRVRSESCYCRIVLLLLHCTAPHDTVHYGARSVALVDNVDSFKDNRSCPLLSDFGPETMDASNL